MEKATMQKAINTMKSAGVTSFGFFARGGNIEMRHDGKTEFIFLLTDYVVSVRPAPSFDNLSNNISQAEINFVPYENIDYMHPYDVSTVEMMDILKAAGVSVNDVNDVVQGIPTRYAPNTNSRAGLEGDVLNNKGEAVLPTGRSGYVVH